MLVVLLYASSASSVTDNVLTVRYLIDWCCID